MFPNGSALCLEDEDEDETEHKQKRCTNIFVASNKNSRDAGFLRDGPPLEAQELFTAKTLQYLFTYVTPW